MFYALHVLSVRFVSPTFLLMLHHFQKYAESAYFWHGVKVDRVTGGHVAHAGCMSSIAFARACANPKCRVSTRDYYGPVTPARRVSIMIAAFDRVALSLLWSRKHACSVEQVVHYTGSSGSTEL